MCIRCAACIQSAWKTYRRSPQRASRLAAVVKIQAHVRAGLARQHAEHLRQEQSAVAAMDGAMTSGSRVTVQAAAAQLVQAGVLEFTMFTCCFRVIIKQHGVEFDASYITSLVDNPACNSSLHLRICCCRKTHCRNMHSHYIDLGANEAVLPL